MASAGEAVDVREARGLADLGRPPSDSRARAAWVRERFVELGCVWYQDAASDRRRASELEDLAVDLLREYGETLPSLSVLKRDVANVSFLPSVVDTLWARAFPPTAADRARNTGEWAVLESVGAKTARLRRSGKAQEAEALRRAAVAFFNKYLSPDEIGVELRRKARQELSKVE